VRREAPGPRHPPRSRGVPARSVRPPGLGGPVRSLRRFVAPGLGAVLLAVGFASAAVAQEDDAVRVVLRMVDSTDPEAVQVADSWSGAADELGSLELRENGDEVDAAVVGGAEAGILHDVMFVV